MIMGKSTDSGMLRKTVLLTCGLSLFFSGFAFSAQSGPQEGSQSPMV